MLRTQISLGEVERALLDDEAARTGRSVSALIRDAVIEKFGHRQDLAADLDALRTSFGAWADPDVDGAAYVEAMRSGHRLRSAD